MDVLVLIGRLLFIGLFACAGHDLGLMVTGPALSIG